MTKVLDTTAYDDKGLVDAYVKAKNAFDLAEAAKDAYKGELIRRGLLSAGDDLYGNRYYLKVSCSFPKKFRPDACEAELGKGFLDKWKIADMTKPEWRLTIKEITVITSENAEKVSAL